MSKQKKNLVTLLVLCVILAVSVVAYFLVPKGDTDSTSSTEDTTSDDDETEDTITVDTIDTDTIVSVKISKKGKTTLSLEKDDDTWKLTDDKEVPLDEDTVTDLFECLNPVSASKEIDKEEISLSDCGLEEPAMTIQVETSDGSSYQYDLGIEVPILGGYYGTSSSGDKIYCMADSLYSTFDIKAKSLMSVEELPEIDESDMKYISVDNKKGDDFEAKKVSKKERVNSSSKWNITKPYDQPLAASTTDWSTTLGYFTDLSFSELEEYNAKDLSKYGLKNPSSVITIKYKKKTLVLYVGKTNSDGDYYVCRKGSSNVYTMLADTVESMTELDVFNAMDTYVYDVAVSEISGFDVSFGKTKLKVTCDTEETSEAASDSAVSSETSDTSLDNTTFTLNGKSVSDDDKSTLYEPYSAISELTYSGKVDSSVKAKSGDSVLTIVYHESGQDVTVKFLPYDGTNFYIVDKDGMNYFLVDKPMVDQIIKKFKNVNN
jgi:hypothetical protein